MELRFPLVLASTSPRRRELLLEGGFAFSVDAQADVEEAHDPALSPEALTSHNARLKAEAVAIRYSGALVLGADTLVYLDGEPLGKPGSLLHAVEMLQRLSGKTHHVCTGVCVCGPESGQYSLLHEVTEVTFQELSEATIAQYLERVYVLDKAGAYAAQDHGGMIIAEMRGSWSNVVGLPMEKVRIALSAWAKA